ncbi:restriction endonuclease subunit S [Candidatus Pelagibacter sp.]|nr:restriction endonuclease subunit S [Candidatus Pelagibacter sp.]
MKEIFFQLDKSDWQILKVGDLASEISERLDKPKDSNYDRFVGLDDFISGDIKIKNWKSTNNLVSSAKIFKKGDILFARRNAYLKRASSVNFDGCCSGDAFVLREDHKKIVPGFLALIMNSNSLWDFAISNAAGTMSKRVKWRDLQKYRCLLPKKKEQKEILNLIESVDEMVDKENAVLDNLKKLYEVSIEQEIHGVDMDGKPIGKVLNELEKVTKLVYLDELGTFYKGKGIPKSALKKKGIPCVRYGEIYTEHNNIIRNFSSHISEEYKNESFKIIKNDLLITGSGETIEEIGKSVAFIDDFEAYAGGDILIFRPHDLDGSYLGYLMNSKLVRYQLNKLGTGSTVMHIYNSDLKNIKVPNIKKNLQIKIVKKLEFIFQCIVQAKKKLVKTKSLRDNLINQVFSNI